MGPVFGTRWSFRTRRRGRSGAVARHLAGVGLAIAILALGAVHAVAAELRGKVTAVTGSDVRIAVDGDLLPQVGDAVRLSFSIQGGPEVPVGQWRVSAVSADGVQATRVQATGTPTVGQTATIDSASPTRRTAAPRATPTPTVALVDITDRNMPSGPLADGQGWQRFDGTVLTVQSSPSKNTWYVLSREAAHTFRATARLRVVSGVTIRSAAILLSLRPDVDQLDEGEVYVGTSQDGSQVEIHRYERDTWRAIASAPSRRTAPDDMVIERMNDRYTVSVNGTTIGRVDAVPGRAAWVRFIVNPGVHAELSAWKVDRLP